MYTEKTATQKQNPVHEKRLDDYTLPAATGILHTRLGGATEKALKRITRFKREDKVALLIGVATYPRGSGLNSLHYAEKDMRALAQELEDNGYLVKVLMNTEAA